MPRTLLRKEPVPIAMPIASSTRPRHGLICAAAAVLTGAVLWLCFFPFAMGWLGWVALAPWLLLVRADLPKRRRYFFAWLGGMAFFVPALAWMRTGAEGMVWLWILLAIYCSTFYAVALWLIRRLDLKTRLPLTITVPVVWTAVDFARAELMGGFAWYLLGQTQQAILPAIQIADIAGVAGLTFVVAAVNGLLAEWLGRVPAVQAWFGLPNAQRRPSVRSQALIVGTFVAIVFGYGYLRLSQSDFQPGPRVALIQTSIPQTDRNAASVAAAGDPLARSTIEEQVAKLTKSAVGQSPRPDLIILPETTFPDAWREIAADAPAGATRTTWKGNLDEYRRSARQFASLAGVPILFGLNTVELAAGERIDLYNSAILITPEGQALGRYDKMHLVPFGEYIPLKDIFPIFRQFSPYGENEYSLTPGAMQTRIPFTAGNRTYQIGVLICYEEADAALARGLVRSDSGPPADFLVDLSNDGWYMSTPEHAEHLAVSRFTAVECRRPLLRAVNGGISAVIDGNGRVVALPKATWDTSHSVTGVVNAVVPLDSRSSFYARVGDWLPWSCWGLLLIGCCWRPKTRPNP
jgi:apolipoprotein N-acyltransferase